MGLLATGMVIIVFMSFMVIHLWKGASKYRTAEGHTWQKAVICKARTSGVQKGEANQKQQLSDYS